MNYSVFKEKYLPPLLVAILLIGGVFSVFHFTKQKKKEIRQNGVSTVCSTYDEGKRLIKVKYNADGQQYWKSVGKSYSNIEDGEEFILIYLPSDPESVVVQFDQPVLSEIYNYQETACLSEVKELSIVKFTYEVGNVRFERRTVYKENQSLSSSNYIVKYRSENPKIGYLIKK